jgi:hypothetical protein
MAGQGAINPAESQTTGSRAEALATFNAEQANKKLEAAIMIAALDEDIEIRPLWKELVNDRYIKVISSPSEGAIRRAAKTIKLLQSLGMNVSYEVREFPSKDQMPDLRYRQPDLRIAEAIQAIAAETLGGLRISSSTERSEDFELFIND